MSSCWWCGDTQDRDSLIVIATEVSQLEIGPSPWTLINYERRSRDGHMTGIPCIHGNYAPPPITCGSVAREGTGTCNSSKSHPIKLWLCLLIRLFVCLLECVVEWMWPCPIWGLCTPENHHKITGLLVSIWHHASPHSQPHPPVLFPSSSLSLSVYLSLPLSLSFPSFPSPSSLPLFHHQSTSPHV